MICRAKQLTGFYMMATLAFNELRDEDYSFLAAKDWLVKLLENTYWPLQKLKANLLLSGRIKNLFAQDISFTKEHWMKVLSNLLTFYKSYFFLALFSLKIVAAFLLDVTKSYLKRSRLNKSRKRS